MSKSLNLLTAFESNGSKAIDIMRKRAFTPDQQKKLRTWGITDACKMVGRSLQTIRDLEKENKIPRANHDTETNRRYYTLQHINQLREYFGTRPHKPKGADTSIIAVTNFKGGVWKTTTSINLAQSFALKGYKVLFIDGDSQGSGTQCFGYIPDSDIDDKDTLLPFLLGDKKDLSAMIRPTYWDSLDLIPANLSLYNAEFELPVLNIRHKQEGKTLKFWDILRQGIEQIKSRYDVIIIDCPPSMGMISMNALFAANSLLIPIPPSMLDFTSTVQFFGMLKDVLQKLPEKEFDFIKLLITKFERSDNALLLVDLIRELYGIYAMKATMPTSEAIKKVGTEMRSIYEIENYAGAKKTLDRIRLAADEVSDELEEQIKRCWSKLELPLPKEMLANV